MESSVVDSGISSHRPQAHPARQRHSVGPGASRVQGVRLLAVCLLLSVFPVGLPMIQDYHLHSNLWICRMPGLLLALRCEQYEELRVGSLGAGTAGDKRCKGKRERESERETEAGQRNALLLSLGGFPALAAQHTQHTQHKRLPTHSRAHTRSEPAQTHPLPPLSRSLPLPRFPMPPPAGSMPALPALHRSSSTVDGDLTVEQDVHSHPCSLTTCTANDMIYVDTPKSPNPYPPSPIPIQHHH